LQTGLVCPRRAGTRRGGDGDAKQGSADDHTRVAREVDVARGQGHIADARDHGRRILARHPRHAPGCRVGRGEGGRVGSALELLTFRQRATDRSQGAHDDADDRDHRDAEHSPASVVGG
jgi:hypothetical protein